MIRVDVWADLVCPWCYIGKRRFERAVASLPEPPAVELVHHSFQLDPEMTPGTTTRQRDVLMAKYGMSAAHAESAMRQAELTAAEDGLEYHLIEGFTGNTFAAHQLVHLAKERGIQDAVVERLYRAHFTELRSLFDTDSLTALVAEAGLRPEDTRHTLDADTYADAVRADIAMARRLGIRGVPFFVLDGTYGISGAQSVAVFADALTRMRSQSTSGNA